MSTKLEGEAVVGLAPIHRHRRPDHVYVRLNLLLQVHGNTVSFRNLKIRVPAGK